MRVGIDVKRGKYILPPFRNTLDPPPRKNPGYVSVYTGNALPIPVKRHGAPRISAAAAGGFIAVSRRIRTTTAHSSGRVLTAATAVTQHDVQLPELSVQRAEWRRTTNGKSLIAVPSVGSTYVRCGDLILDF